MKKNESITKVMTSDVRTVHTGQKLSEVRRLMGEASIHHVPVVSGKALVGILSSTDLMRLSVETYGADERSMDAMLDHQFDIEAVMKSDPVTLTTKATVRDAAVILSEGTFHSLPIVDAEGALAGIVTSTDLIRYLLDQY